MLPALNLSNEKSGFRLLQYFGLVNCYLDHLECKDKSSDTLYLVFNPTIEAMRRFHEFYNVYRRYPNYVGDYILDHNLIVVMFKVENRWRKALESFMKSKYSQMGADYANNFKRVDPTTNRTIYMKEYYIIHKHKDYKKLLEDKLSNVVGSEESLVHISDEAELMDRLDLNNEIFSYEYNNRATEVQPG